jgi:ABC-2 type transport system permease protein
MTEPATPRTGVIYDIGYQHYDGPRLGRAGAVRALYVEGIRSIFGIGRGAKAKIPPVALIAMMVIPALIQSAVAGLAGNLIQLFAHATYFRTTVWLFGLFCAFQTPELITSDSQSRVLALYFSRAVRRSDYVLARVAALATSLFVVALLPHIVLLAGTWMSSEDVMAAMKTSLPTIPRIVAGAFAIAILLSTVSITIAAVLKRRPFATAAILAFFLLASAFVTPLIMQRPDKMRYLALSSPMIVGDGVTTWIFDTTSVKQKADSIAALDALDAKAGAPKTAADSVQQMRRRFRRRNRTVLQAANLPGLAYLGTMAGFIVIAGVVLTLRYRSIET